MEIIDRLYFWFRHQFEASYTFRILNESLDLLNMLWPYLVGGIIFTTLIYMYLSKKRVAGFFSSRTKHVSIITAAVLGIVSPLGSYVIIPLSAALLTIGVPLPVLMALVVSSPIINPNLFILTAGAIDIEMAVMRTLSALILGTSAGYLTQWLISKKWIVPEMILKKTPSNGINQFQLDNRKVTFKLFFTELYKMTRYISRYFFLAIILAAVIKIFSNPYTFVKLFDKNEMLTVLITTAAGVPFYVCGGAAIPVVQQLAELGLARGAVLAFFISGPVTKISNLVILHAAFKRKILFIYLATGLFGALLLGLLFNLIS
ncbi:MAG: permease [Prolixibacteraceae bacterium]|jgi:uncharacterized membrane protein YraQ (UPF0718 family)|nr:permease [Prolixibacteraceae bacterium]